MITKVEFLALYEKYISGQCTADEKKLLDTYRDEMILAEDDWDDDLVKEEVRARIWQRLSSSRKVIQLPSPKVTKYRWLQVAAVFMAVLFAGLFFMQRKKNHETDTVKLTANKAQKQILPGGNKAYLTLANGSRIVLDDAKNGNLASRSGVTVSKAGNGTVVYHFTNSVSNTASAATPEFNTITTPRGGQYQVVLEDGTRVWLNAASSIKFPQAFTGATREVELTGEAYFEVAKNKAKPFIVLTNGTKVQVFGTHFNINAYPDNNNMTTTLLEGSVRMDNGSSAVMLLPGQQGTALKSGAAIKVSRADIQQTMAWKNGFFIFHDLNITEVMKQVARWYDVDVEYRDDDVKNNEFGGTISKYKNITELLDVMSLTRSIHYKIEGRRVIIMK